VDFYFFKMWTAIFEKWQACLLHNNIVFAVKIWGFSCDAPARSFITGTKGHTAKNACPKCLTTGVYYRKPGKKGGRMTFPDLNADLRTHESFVNKEHADYHHMESIIEQLNLDIVKDFPMDYMVHRLYCIVGLYNYTILNSTWPVSG